MDILVDNFWKGQTATNQPQNVPGFFVRSTAPINMEDSEQITDETLPTINDVVERLYQNSQLNTSFTGLVIQIHGYNTGVQTSTYSEKDANDYDYINIQDDKRLGVKDYIYKDWKKTYDFLNHPTSAIADKLNSFVYVGYRWPSESVPSDPYTAATSLPIILKWLFRGGLIIGAVGLLLLILLPSAITDTLTALLVFGGAAFSALIASLFILRIIVYFRDAYRATNFGVPDLVEFIRQLDLGLVKRRINEAVFNTVTEDVSQGSNVSSDLLAQAVRKTWELIESQSELLDDRNDETFRLLLPKLKQGNLAQLDDAVFFSIYASFVRAKKPTYSAEDVQKAATYWNQKNKRIRLTFIGHSMGAFVTTQVIRILSDAFDPKAIGDSTTLEKLPSSTIGRAFSLGRLVLVSPDIPLRTILSGRTNFLRSSLRRFEEAYLFSSEGDLALRLASTAANYFSFPARTRSQGFRLGNVSVNLPGGHDVYGIVNLDKLPGSEPDPLLRYIGVQSIGLNERDLTASKRRGIDKDKDLRAARLNAQSSLTRLLMGIGHLVGIGPKDKADQESLASEQDDPESIADLFTYFDCTEYCDVTTYWKRENQEMNVMIGKGQRSPLNGVAYAKLLKAYICFSKNPSVGVDVHGGYFYGQFSKLLIYRLAFLGFQGLLDSIIVQDPDAFHLKPPFYDVQDQLNQARLLPLKERRKAALNYLSWLCKQKKIQVAASRERYDVDVLGRDRREIKDKILTQAKKCKSDSTAL